MYNAAEGCKKPCITHLQRGESIHLFDTEIAPAPQVKILSHVLQIWADATEVESQPHQRLKIRTLSLTPHGCGQRVALLHNPLEAYGVMPSTYQITEPVQGRRFGVARTNLCCADAVRCRHLQYLWLRHDIHTAPA